LTMSLQPLKRRRAPRGSGDQLRDEILDATTELLMETGHAKAVSIRSVAQRVGVTPPSIYLHFADKDALLDAVCARYFEKLDEEMQRVSADQTSTVDVLRAQGLAYVRFAMRTPELYRIATMGEGRPGSDIDTTLNSSAFAHLRNSVELLIEEGVFRAGLDALDVHLLISSFCFYRVSNRHTFGEIFQIDLPDESIKQRHREMICESVLRYLQP